MNHTASQVNVVLAQLALDTDKVAFHLHIVEMEQRHCQFHQYATHFDRRVTGFRIYTSGVRHAYGKVYIPHYFGEHNGRNLRNLHGLIILPVVETNIFQRRSFDVGRREPIGHCVNIGNDILFVIDLLKSVLIVGYPTTSLQYGNCFLRLNLVAGVAAGLCCFRLFGSRNVELAEHLFERLADCFIEQEFLICVPVAACIQVGGVGDA